jgi:coenzyme PQQ biosynthesis protein C
VTEALPPSALEEALRAIGARRYHNLHPFHRLMSEGRCTKAQLQAWALNRYHYQATIPIKDAAILARMDDPALRREWRRRIIDHDGDRDGEGGLEKWLKLTEGLGLDRDLVTSRRAILPITRFAVEAYVNFCSTRSLLEAIASSLTELFSPAIISERVAGMLAHYDFVSPETLSYFTARSPQARRDSDFALNYLKAHATTAETQQAALDALAFKCDILWAMSDALTHAYVEGHIPPGAWVPEAS